MCWGEVKRGYGTGGQNAELRKNNQSRCAAMRASPMWRPGHYRMHSSCLDSLRHEIFHQTKAEVRGSRRERSLRFTLRPKEKYTRSALPRGGVNYGSGLCGRSRGGWKPIQKLIPDLKPWRNNPSEITHFRRRTCRRPWNTEAADCEQDGTQKTFPGPSYPISRVKRCKAWTRCFDFSMVAWWRQTL